MSDAASIAREYLECFNSRDWTKMRGLLHPDSTYVGGDGQVAGGEAGVEIGQAFAEALPDGKLDIKHQHAAGNTVVTEFVGTGTHDGDLMGIPPSGRRVTIPVCNIIEVKDGKIISEREYMDMLHVMQQIGAAPAPATA